MLNIIIILIIIIFVFIFLFIIFKNNFEIKDEEDINVYEIEYLVEGIKNTFNNILKANLTELNLNRNETIKREKNKIKLRKSLRDSGYGDIGAKAYIKEYIKELLQKKFNINENTINNVICFDDQDKLTIKDKFDILLHIYKKQHDLYGLEVLITENNLDCLKNDLDGDYYKITTDDISSVYSKRAYSLNFSDKLEILSQRVYQFYKGHGVIDDIRDMKVDGVSGGVSGISGEFNQLDFEKPLSYNSVWIFFRGKTIHLSFLGFDTQRELERVCKNIYRYNNPGQLSEARGYIANDMKDGSRVVVVRPPFAESWAFFVRKFDSVTKSDIRDLIKDEGNEDVINIMKWIIKGCRVSAITGSQGSGKTTLLMALIQFINKTYTLRIQELVFELNLRKLYPDRNILTFRETDTVSGQEGLDIQKKTDGTVNILGEVATAPVASWLIQVSQVASLFTLFTHHAKTSENLITAMRNALLQAGGFSNEKIAEEQASQTINFDIHMSKRVDGHRYIERITEIIPTKAEDYPSNLKDSTKEYFTRVTDRRIFNTVDIVVYEDNRYVVKNNISERSRQEIINYLTNEEAKELEMLFGEAEAIT